MDQMFLNRMPAMSTLCITGKLELLFVVLFESNSLGTEIHYLRCPQILFALF